MKHFINFIYDCHFWTPFALLVDSGQWTAELFVDGCQLRGLCPLYVSKVCCLRLVISIELKHRQLITGNGQLAGGLKPLFPVPYSLYPALGGGG
jgi:hypothetical protein